jgi:hypothetical protein
MNGGVYQPVNNTLPAVTYERGKWYYIDEEFKAATEKGRDTNNIMAYNTDGEYRLWFSESGVDTGNEAPILEVTNLTMGPLRDTTIPGNGPNNSFWGNVQHFEHTVGSWYIDDMFITGDIADTSLDGNSRRRIGPVTTGICANVTTPKPPTATN